MKKMVLSLVAVQSVCAIAAVSFRAPEVIPVPEKVTHAAETEVRLDDSLRVDVCCGEAGAAEWVRSHLALWFKVKPDVRESAWTEAADGSGEAVGAYRLEADASGLSVRAKTLQGVRYALFSLRQVAERASVGDAVAYYRMPKFTIVDSPALKFRGLHLCWFPEQSAALIEREIRTAAFYKYNVVVLESWGVFRSEKFPWYGWKDGPMTKEVVRHLVAVAKDLGVTLVPQLNVFGHACAARSCVGKHAALDFSPERQPLFEPGGAWSAGWNWCLTNPTAVQTVRGLVVEMHEVFGNPPYFHIGCDEADEPSCASCRAEPYARLVCRHIAGISELLQARGARAMMWHDMLLLRGDRRWKDFYANGSEETAKLPSMLPKNVIVCEWYYGGAMQAYPTLDYFAGECGFDTLTSPWEDQKGIQSQAKYACENGLFGLLETTWHHFGGERFTQMVQTAACGAWGHGMAGGFGHFAMIWRQAGWDMGAPSYRESGWFDTQTSRDIQAR